LRSKVIARDAEALHVGPHRWHPEVGGIRHWLQVSASHDCIAMRAEQEPRAWNCQQVAHLARIGSRALEQSRFMGPALAVLVCGGAFTSAAIEGASCNTTPPLFAPRRRA
jgi:hypothetical protein